MEPKTAAERIRAGLLDTLQQRFAEFRRHAAPEERWIMLEVLNSHESVNRGSLADDLVLAQTFDLILGKVTPDYVRVPEKMRKQVMRYIEALEAANLRD